MGLNMSWIAVKGRTPAEMLDSLSMAETGYHGEFTDSDFSLAELPTGWTVVMAMDSGWATPKLLALTSAGAEAIGCQMSETVMYSSGWGYEDGVQKWSMVHYLDQEKILEVEGEPPPEFAAIRDDLFRQQEAEDGVDFIFEAPIALSAAICGFRPDEDLPTFPFETECRYLQEIRKPRGPRGPGPFAWLGRLFSGNSKPT